MRRLSAPLEGALVAVLLAGLLIGCAGSGNPLPEGHRPSRPTAAPTGPGASGSASPDRAAGSRAGRRIERLLAAAAVVEQTGYHPGYDRACDPGAGCVFGEEWTDDHPGRFGHNGCDTRQDVLLQQMRDVELRWGSTCRIFEASLVDPYSGELLTWQDDGYFIQIDHVYPLAQAWYAGAWAWPQSRRVRFANDVDRELLAVSGRANQDKGAAGPGSWLPENAAYRCRYVTKYLVVAAAYHLPITRADALAIAAVARRC